MKYALSMAAAVATVTASVVFSPAMAGCGATHTASAKSSGNEVTSEEEYKIAAGNSDGGNTSVSMYQHLDEEPSEQLVTPSQ